MFWKTAKRFKEVAYAVLEMKQIRSPATRRNATRQINRLVLNFGEMRVDEISEGTWIRYIRNQSLRKHRTFRDDKTYMRMILLHAFREGVIKRMIRLQIPDLPSCLGREITPEEIQELLCRAGEELAFQINIAWRMGFRLGEMLSLRWDQFDWVNRIVVLKPSDTKTRKKRAVPIPDDLFDVFSARKESNNSLYVFPSPTKPNAPCESNKTAWVKCKKRANIKARWHDLRHTCCSQLLRNGVRLQVVCAYLGMSEAVANRIYAHVNMDDLRSASQKLSGTP